MQRVSYSIRAHPSSYWRDRHSQNAGSEFAPQPLRASIIYISFPEGKSTECIQVP